MVEERISIPALIARLVGQRPDEPRTDSAPTHFSQKFKSFTRGGMTALAVTWGVGGLAQVGAGTSAASAATPMVTNVAQLHRLAAKEWRFQCGLALTGVVCSVSTAKGIIILADETGAELLWLDSGTSNFQV